VVSVTEVVEAVRAADSAIAAAVAALEEAVADLAIVEEALLAGVVVEAVEAVRLAVAPRLLSSSPIDWKACLLPAVAQRMCSSPRT